MNSRWAMIGMFVVLVLCGGAVVYFGMREPERTVHPPLAPETKTPAAQKTVPPPRSEPAPAPPPQKARMEPEAAQGAVAVDGQVNDSAGKPVAGATIHAGRETEGAALASTGPDGRFELKSIPPTRLLTAVCAGYASQTVDLAVGASSPIRVSIVMEKTSGIAGTVLRGGSPGAQIKVAIQGGTQHVLTDEKGAYAIEPLAPGSYTVRLELTDGPTPDEPPAPWLARTVQVTAGAISTADFSIPDCDSGLEGFVIVEGRPFAQAEVVLNIDASQGNYLATTQTTSDGGYRFSSLPNGAAAVKTVIPLANGSERKKMARLELTVHEGMRQDFDFPLSGMVQGQVVGLQPDDHATVLALKGSAQDFNNMSFEQLVGMHQSVAADTSVASDGSFAFEALDPGDYVLMIMAGQQGTADFRSRVQPVTVTAGGSASVRILMR